jgi:hypothetical protein
MAASGAAIGGGVWEQPGLCAFEFDLGQPVELARQPPVPVAEELDLPEHRPRLIPLSAVDGAGLSPR